jgi:hypothetical protein
MIAFPGPRPASADWRRLAVLAAFALLTALVVAICVPINPRMPSSGLDPSWVLGMGVAVAKKLALGKDLIFTFGPLPSLYTFSYNQYSYQLIVSLSVYISIATAFLIAYLLSGSLLLIGFALYIFLFIVISPDALYAFYGVLYFFYLERAFLTADRSRHVGMVLLAIPLAIFPLVKGSFIVSAFGYIAFSLLMLVIRRRYWATALLAGTYAVAVPALWTLSGQHFPDLWGYFASMMPIIGGYSEAMASNGPVEHVLLYLLATVLMGAALRSALGGRRPEFWTGAIGLGFFLFLSFKAGFVRHDGHALAASTALCLVLPLLYARIGDRWMRNWWAHAAVVAYVLLAAFIIQVRYAGSSPMAMLSRASDRLRTVEAGMPLVFGKRNLDADYAAALANIRRAAPLRSLDGTTDIYPYDQAQLIASGNDWDPRPILQSYSAYEPILAELDRQHLIGPEAPDNIVFGLKPIDGRIPSLEDGVSWLEMMSRYTLKDFDGTFTYLRRRPDGGHEIDQTVLPVQNYRLGQSFPVPHTGDPVFAKIDIHPTGFGKFVNALFKIPSLVMTMTMADGSTRAYRAVSSMMSTGFVISPMVNNTQTFAFLVSGNQDVLRGDKVVSAEIDVPLSWLHLWNARFTVQYGIVHPERQNIPATMTSKMDRGFAATTESTQACNGVIDYVNGKLLGSSREAEAARVLTLNGWLAGAEGIAGVPEKVLVRVTFSDGSSAFYETYRTPRDDVKRHLKNRTMADVGYSAIIDLTDRLRVVSLVIVAAHEKTLIGCNNLSVALKAPM